MRRVTRATGQGKRKGASVVAFVEEAERGVAVVADRAAGGHALAEVEHDLDAVLAVRAGLDVDIDALVHIPAGADRGLAALVGDDVEIVEPGGAAELREDADGRLVLPHTLIVPSFRGRGLAGVLVGRALEDIASRGETVVPECPVVARYLQENEVPGLKVDWPDAAGVEGV